MILFLLADISVDPSHGWSRAATLFPMLTFISPTLCLLLLTMPLRRGYGVTLRALGGMLGNINAPNAVHGHHPLRPHLHEARQAHDLRDGRCPSTRRGFSPLAPPSLRATGQPCQQPRLLASVRDAGVAEDAGLRAGGLLAHAGTVPPCELVSQGLANGLRGLELVVQHAEQRMLFVSETCLCGDR